MSTRQQLIKARLGMLARAEELQNISAACKKAGISRSHYYEIKEAFEKYGAEGLAPRERRRPRMPNQTPPELERRILEMTEQYPIYSYVRISGQLRLIGVGVSPSAVRAVWARRRTAAIYCARILISSARSKALEKSICETVVDAHCSLGFAKLHLSKAPITAVDAA